MTGRVYDELKSNITRGSKLSVISAYFTIYGYASLKKELNSIDNMRFLFTEPTFVQNSNEVSREFCIDHENQHLIMIFERSDKYLADRSGLVWRAQYPMPSGPCALCGSLLLMIISNISSFSMLLRSVSLSSSVSL